MHNSKVVEYATALSCHMRISDIEKIKDWLIEKREHSRLPFYTDKNRNNALHYAVRNQGRIEWENLFFWLFEHDNSDISSYVNATNFRGETSLHHAIKYGNNSCIINFLFALQDDYDYQLNLNIFNSEGFTPLALALFLNDREKIEVLAEYVSDEEWDNARDVLLQIQERNRQLPEEKSDKKRRKGSSQLSYHSFDKSKLKKKSSSLKQRKKENS